MNEQVKDQLRQLNEHLAIREPVDELLPEERRIEGVPDDVVRAAEELGLI